MRTILVINSKGGSGKTTLTTNIASYFASQKIKTAILDCDPQGSSLQWIKSRPQQDIHGANGAPTNGASSLSSMKMWIPSNTEALIIDAPAGTKGMLLQNLVRRSNYIVIPVAPSPIDIHATAGFIKDLYLTGGARNAKAKIAVVANRVRLSSPAYEPLERFLTALKLPFLSRISDSDNYLRAVEQGLGVFEMEEHNTHAERQELIPIFRWLDGHEHVPAQSASDLPGKVVSIEKTGKFATATASKHAVAVAEKAAHSQIVAGKSILNSLLNSATGQFKKFT